MQSNEGLMIRSLFEGKKIYLTLPDEEKDLEIIAGWTHDPEFIYLTDPQPIRPLFKAQVKKQLEKFEKNKNEQYLFAIRAREGDRLVGLVALRWLDWANGTGLLTLHPGSPVSENFEYAEEALSLILRYAFTELNLFRLTARIPEYLPTRIELFKRAGFQEEVRRRESLRRFGRYWDSINFGLLCDEWRVLNPEMEDAS
jgi:RimJ/RimL family protein N-acetyltransferase